MHLSSCLLPSAYCLLFSHLHVRNLNRTSLLLANLVRKEQQMTTLYERFRTNDSLLEQICSDTDPVLPVPTLVAPARRVRTAQMRSEAPSRRERAASPQIWDVDLLALTLVAQT